MPSPNNEAIMPGATGPARRLAAFITVNAAGAGEETSAGAASPVGVSRRTRLLSRSAT